MSAINFLSGPSGLVSGRATLVFIHGAGGSARTWERQVAELDGLANTIAVDLPGHGSSAKPGRDSIPGYADAVISLLDRLAAPDPVPVGLSMGGAITQQILLDHPGRFARAVLVSTGPRLKVLPLIFEKLAGDFAGYVDLMGRAAFSYQAPEEIKRDTLADTASQDPVVIAQDFNACNVFDVTGRLGEIKSRVLVVSGTDDFLTPMKFSDRLVAGIPGARLARFSGCGHMVPQEKPAELAAALGEFLRS